MGVVSLDTATIRQEHTTHQPQHPITLQWSTYQLLQLQVWGREIMTLRSITSSPYQNLFPTITPFPYYRVITSSSYPSSPPHTIISSPYPSSPPHTHHLLPIPTISSPYPSSPPHTHHLPPHTTKEQCWITEGMWLGTNFPGSSHQRWECWCCQSRIGHGNCLLWRGWLSILQRYTVGLAWGGGNEKIAEYTHTHTCTHGPSFKTHEAHTSWCTHGYDIIMHQGQPWLLWCGGRYQSYVHIQVEEEGRLKA